AESMSAGLALHAAAIRHGYVTGQRVAGRAQSPRADAAHPSSTSAATCARVRSPTGAGALVRVAIGSPHSEQHPKSIQTHDGEPRRLVRLERLYVGPSSHAYSVRQPSARVLHSTRQPFGTATSPARHAASCQLWQCPVSAPCTRPVASGSRVSHRTARRPHPAQWSQTRGARATPLPAPPRPPRLHAPPF